MIHPTAVIDPGAILGEGCRIWHFCHVSAGARIGADVTLGQNVYVAGRVTIGRGCRIQNNVSLYDDVTLEEDVFCGPSMVFTNVINPRAFVSRKHEYRPTLVRRGASLGANCTILCGVTIGAFALVAAGAVVRQDVADFAMVAGVPAVRKGWVGRSGSRLDFVGGLATCSDTGERYQLSGDRVSLLG